MKRLSYYLFGLFLIVCLSNFSLASAYTNNSITGKAVAQQTSLLVQVMVPPPLISLTSPINGTYLKYNDILVNYSAKNQFSVWYNIDNSANISLDSPTYLNLSEGKHKLFIFANNTDGIIAFTNVTFYLNDTLLTLKYDNFSTYPESIDFYSYTYESMQNLTNVTLDNVNYGEIKFNNPINLTEYTNTTNDVIDLNRNILIGLNIIKLNSSALPNFNTPATLKFYNVEFTNPTILMDGSPCPPSVCTEQNFSNNIFTFNVAHFSAYSLAESTQTVTSQQSNGGGRGGEITTKNNALISVDPVEESISLKPGQVKSTYLNITNKDRINLNLSIESSYNLFNFIKFSEDAIFLSPGESKLVGIEFIATENTPPNLYVGSIKVISSSGFVINIPTAIDANALNALFDLKLNILNQNLVVSPGDDISGAVTLSNLGETGRIDALLKYSVEDENGNIIASAEETAAVETQASFVKTISLPSNIKEGKYLMTVEADYNNNVARASEWFDVQQQQDTTNTLLYVLISLVVLLILGLVVNIMITYRKLGPSRINEKTLTERGYFKK